MRPSRHPLAVPVKPSPQRKPRGLQRLGSVTWEKMLQAIKALSTRVDGTPLA